MKMFQIRLAVVDPNPNSGDAHEFAKKYEGRVLCCYYSESQRAQLSIADDVLEQLRLKRSTDPLARWDFTVNRTETIDDTVKELVNGTVLLPDSPTHPENEEFYAHVNHNVRRRIDQPSGTPIYRWVRVHGANDYLMAANYGRIACELGKVLSQISGAPAPFSISGGSAKR